MIYIEIFLLGIAILGAMLGNDTPKNLYKYIFKKDMDETLSPQASKPASPKIAKVHAFIYLVGTILVIASLGPMLSAPMGTIVGWLRSFSEPEEETQYRLVLKCVSESCPADLCVSTFENRFPSSKHTEPLRELARKKASSCSPPPPPLPVDPIWQQLSDLLIHAEKEASYQADEVLRDFYNLKVKKALAGQLSDEQLQLSRKAEQVIRKLADSDLRLEAMHDVADAWRIRKGFEAPDISDAMGNLNSYDKQRVEPEGYGGDWNMLQTAIELLKWPKLGFMSAIKAGVPVYMVQHHTPDIDDQIASGLKDALANNLSFTDEQHAALFIEIKEANSYPERLERAGDQLKGRTTFNISMHWIGGRPLPPIHIDEESHDISGDSSRDDAVQINSMKTAIKKASEKILLLAK